MGTTAAMGIVLAMRAVWHLLGLAIVAWEFKQLYMY
jgi:hypothetical protein